MPLQAALVHPHFNSVTATDFSPAAMQNVHYAQASLLPCGFGNAYFITGQSDLLPVFVAYQAAFP